MKPKSEQRRGKILGKPTVWLFALALVGSVLGGLGTAMPWTLAQQALPVSLNVTRSTVNVNRPADPPSAIRHTPSALAAQPSAISQSSHASRPQLDRSFGKLPLSFERNDGQTDPQVQFLSRGRGYTLFLTPTEAVLALKKPLTLPSPSRGEGNSVNPSLTNSDPHVGAGLIPARQKREGVKPSPTNNEAQEQQAILRMKLEGSNPAPTATGMDKLPGIVNYFLGSDPAKWRTDIPTYQKVEYKEVYPGIDLAYYGNQGQLEYDLIVAPGADPNQIKLAFEGPDDISVDSTGNLVMKVVGGDLRLLKPHVYQTIAGKKVEVAANYIINSPSPAPLPPGARVTSVNPSSSPSTSRGDGKENSPLPPEGEGQGEGEKGHQVALHVGIQLASYDHTKPLIIDPVLFWSTYLGGNSSDVGFRVALDAAGNAYVAGSTATFGSGFPGTSGSSIQPTHGGAIDVFVSKLNAAGTALVYATYLGGSADDRAAGIAVDAAGNAYVTGSTDTLGSGFPGTSGSSIQPTHGGATDGFVTKINAAGTALVYSTYLGGSDSDRGDGIAVDAGGNAYVTGATQTTGSGFPGTTGSLMQSTYGGGRDGFVTKINAAGTALVYSTYLGGSGTDRGFGIAVDAAGNAYVTGQTSTTGSGFPGTAGSSIQSLYGGGFDAFVTKINAAGTALLYSTYLGGSGIERGDGIAVDMSGNAYVTGPTDSVGFPGTVSSPIQATYGGGPSDAFVTKLNAAGTALVYSTYLGGSGAENGSFDIGPSIAVDAGGNAYVTGWTLSTNFPTASPLQAASGGGTDAFVTKVNAAGSALVYSTYLGGSANDEGYGIAVDAAGNAHITGVTQTTGSGFPGISGSSVQPTFGGGFSDAFVAKICEDQTGTPGTWGGTGSLVNPRHHHTATVLSNGNVVVAGGFGGTLLASAEVYEPAMGTWSTTGSLATARDGHTATLLPNGKILVAGGSGLSSAELYDPATGTWSTTGSLADARASHTATLLSDGTVLVAGGSSDTAGGTRFASAEVYDPATGTWSTTGSLANARVWHTATLLSDGTVLVAGGSGSSTPLTSAELYDPATGTWSATGSLAAARHNHTATLLPNGRVLVAAGLDLGFFSVTVLASAELYDPTAGTWSTTASLAAERSDHIATLLPNGKVLVAGGDPFGGYLTSAELYDPATGTWSTTGSLADARAFHTATLLPDGLVLVAGGSAPSALASSELYTPFLCGSETAPVISSISPTSGSVGTSVTITGLRFGTNQGTSTLTFNGTSAGSINNANWNDTQIVATVPSGATTGPVVVTVNGEASNGQTFTVTAPDFTLSASPPSQTVAQGASTTYTVSLGALNGFNSAVTLSVTSGLPSGATASFSPNPVTPPGSSTLTVSTTGSTPTGSSTLVIQGVGDGQTHVTSVALTITAAGGGLPLAITPASATVLTGSQTTFGATGGTGPYTFSFVTNQSGATLNASTGLYTAGGVAGTDTIRVTDALNATSEAIITVTPVAGGVPVSLDAQALGPGLTLSIAPQGGGAALYAGLTTDRVQELQLSAGAYRLIGDTVSLDFSVTAACTITLP